MTIFQARDERPAMKIDDMGGWPGKFSDIGVFSDGFELATCYRDRLGEGEAGIDSHNLAVDVDRVGSGASGRSHQRREHNYSMQFQLSIVSFISTPAGYLRETQPLLIPEPAR